MVFIIFIHSMHLFDKGVFQFFTYRAQFVKTDKKFCKCIFYSVPLYPKRKQDEMRLLNLSLFDHRCTIITLLQLLLNETKEI